MTTSSANGRAQRKSLAEQIDRLDRILDGLADGLNEAVATAVKEAVAAAVEAALTEVLASAELQRRLRVGQTAEPGKVGSMVRLLLFAAQGCWNRLARIAAGCRAKGAQALAAVAEGRKAVVVRVRRRLSTFGRRLWLGAVAGVALVRHFGRPLLVALAVGAALGLGCYLAGPAVSSAVSGLAGFAGSLLAGGLNRLRRMTTRHDWQEWPVGHVR